MNYKRSLINWQMFTKNPLYERSVSLIMDMYTDTENVVGWLNNKMNSGPKAEVEQDTEGKSSPWKISLGCAFQKDTSIWSTLQMNVCLQITYWPGSHQFCSLSCTDKTWETDNLAFIFPRPLFLFHPSNCCCLCCWVWYVNPIRDFSFLDSYTIYGRHAHLM